MERIKNVTKEDIGTLCIVNGKHCAFVRSPYNKAVLATKRENNIVELLCFEGELSHNHLLLQETGLAGESIEDFE